eukprot:CAMPEP_0173215062 /NCGR_PEP_ID=MMETSP1141-20130122/26291_1 /TAXON_ID=483371 /ORGANISM="non described non described, Strain CCMP2298" /LENGTH=72 /DNA_ID=CAMNT_0014142439 /DNA_START=133 /DNA_END=347 /DNA_ORIENTATION=+
MLLGHCLTSLLLVRGEDLLPTAEVLCVLALLPQAQAQLPHSLAQPPHPHDRFLPTTLLAPLLYTHLGGTSKR